MIQTFSGIGSGTTCCLSIVSRFLLIRICCAKCLSIDLYINVSEFKIPHDKISREVVESISTRGHCECSGCTVISTNNIYVMGKLLDLLSFSVFSIFSLWIGIVFLQETVDSIPCPTSHWQVHVVLLTWLPLGSLCHACLAAQNATCCDWLVGNCM